MPYAGGPAQAMNDVMSGRVPLVLDGYAGLAPAIKGNLIKGLASTAIKRPPGFENLPTMAETVPGLSVGAWNVMLAPVGTPDAIVQKVHADLARRARRSGRPRQVRRQRRLRTPPTPDEVIAFVQNEQKTWRPILEKVAKEAEKK